MSEVKPMALSTAIRLGAMAEPQAFYRLHEEREKGRGHGDVLAIPETRTASCALGSAMKAAGFKPPLSLCMLADSFDMQVLTALQAATCPVCGNTDGQTYPGPYGHVVAHLNNVHRWSREAIADFVETIEQQSPSPALVSEGHADEVTV